MADLPPSPPPPTKKLVNMLKSQQAYQLNRFVEAQGPRFVNTRMSVEAIAAEASALLKVPVTVNNVRSALTLFGIRLKPIRQSKNRPRTFTKASILGRLEELEQTISELVGAVAQIQTTFGLPVTVTPLARPPAPQEESDGGAHTTVAGGDPNK